jgi:outer membrane receptor protein involved in Fe transport
MASVLDGGRAVSTYDNDVAGGAAFPEFRFGKAGTLTLAGLLKFDRADLQDQRGGTWTTTAAETYSAAAQYAARVSIVDLAAGIAEHFYRRTKTPGKDLGGDNAATDAQLGVSVRPLPFLQVRAAAARKSAFPDLKTLYGSEGNPDLRPESAWNFDAGVRADPVREVGVEATFFYSDVTDLIGKRDTGNEFTYENVDTATLWGLEGALRLSFWDDRVTASAGYTFLKTRDGRSGRALDALDFRPEHTLALAAEVAFPFGTRLAAQYLYVGARRYEQASGGGVRSLPEYGTIGARVSHRFAWREGRTSLELFLEGRNLADVYYETSPERAAPGRMLDAGVAVEF